MPWSPAPISEYAVLGFALLCFEGLIDALSDISRLIMDRIEHATGGGIETILRAVVTDVFEHLAHDGWHINIGLRANLARYEHHACGSHGLAGATHRARIGGCARRRDIALFSKLDLLSKDSIENCVRDLIADLVGVPFRYRLAREDVRGISHISIVLSVLLFAYLDASVFCAIAERGSALGIPSTTDHATVLLELRDVSLRHADIVALAVLDTRTFLVGPKALCDRCPCLSSRLGLRTQLFSAFLRDQVRRMRA